MSHTPDLEPDDTWILSLEDEADRLDAINDELLEALEEIDRWTRDCSRCGGSGKDPTYRSDACHSCGGYGFEAYGDILEAIVGARAAIAKARGGDS